MVWKSPFRTTEPEREYLASGGIVAPPPEFPKESGQDAGVREIVEGTSGQGCSEAERRRAMKYKTILKVTHRITLPGGITMLYPAGTVVEWDSKEPQNCKISHIRSVCGRSDCQGLGECADCERVYGP